MESQKGIDFIYQQKLLIAEKFINIQFLVPFPRLNVSLENQFRNLSLLLKNSWNDYSFGCQLDHMNTNESSLNFDYLLRHRENDFKSVQLDILNMKKEIHRTFGTKEQTTKQTDNERTKRGAGLIALGALTAVAAGAGIACSLGSIFGACGGSSQDREDIDLALSQIELNNHRLVEVKGKVYSKIYLIAEQLDDLNSVQKQSIQTQKNHTMVPMKAVDIIQNNSRALMACSQLFYPRDQMLQVQASLLGSFSALLNELKMYRVVIYSYKLTILNSVMIMVNKLIPMALLPRSDFEEILRDVNHWQSETNERLSLAIPITQILTYYETKILINVDIVDNGMYFTLAIPFFTAATVLNLYKAVPIPMPNDGTDRRASQYAIESDFIAVSSTQKSSITFTR